MNTDIVAYYAKRAEEYEKIYDKPERQPELLELKERLKTDFSELDVLEIACGTGYWTQVIAETAASIVATDISQQVIAVAKAKTYPNQNVVFSLADGHSLASVPPDFAAGFGGFIWSHIPLEKLDHFLDTLHSKIKAQGKIVFIDNTYAAGSSTVISHRDSGGNTYQQRLLKDGSSHLVMKNFPTEGQIKSVLTGKAVRVEFKSLQYFWYLLYNKA